MPLPLALTLCRVQAAAESQNAAQTKAQAPSRCSAIRQQLRHVSRGVQERVRQQLQRGGPLLRVSREAQA